MSKQLCSISYNIIAIIVVLEMRSFLLGLFNSTLECVLAIMFITASCSNFLYYIMTGQFHEHEEVYKINKIIQVKFHVILIADVTVVLAYS